MKKILIYNWDKINGSHGGGVNTYIKNLVDALIKTSSYEIYFLNSGWTYTKDLRLKIQEIQTEYEPDVKAFEIINSPVLAPSRQSCLNLELYLEDESLKKIIREFLIANGPFEVIHFNNLEGLSLKVLELKKEFKNTRFIYSAHNYFLVCSRVNLWKDEKKTGGFNCECRDYSECVLCYEKYRRKYTLALRTKRTTKFRVRLYNLFNHIFHDKEKANIYEQFVRKNIEYINMYVDCVAAVSKRVKEILEKHGVDSKKIVVSYIGTKVAEEQKNFSNVNYNSDIFSIVYMGYMRKIKGFNFFLNALEKMPDQFAEKMSVRIVARYSLKNKSEIKRIYKLRKRYHSVELINGYNAENQKELLQGMHLGVVPVLWEDNLPQVAIEQIAYGVPILTSDLGGAHELFNNNSFVFKAGDTHDFINKLVNIFYNRDLLNEFWSSTMKLVTMKEHIDQIIKLYEG